MMANPANQPPHSPGCRMPACEGECLTNSGLSPAEERMLTDTPTPRTADRRVVATCKHCGGDAFLIHAGPVPEPWHEAEAAAPPAGLDALAIVEAEVMAILSEKKWPTANAQRNIDALRSTLSREGAER